MEKFQTGFVPGCGTHMNIQLLIQKIKQIPKEENYTFIFVDFSSAYNTVIRSKLW